MTNLTSDIIQSYSISNSRYARPAGIAFPTCVSVNNTVAHFSPLESDPSSSQTLAKGDVVKLHLGAHIDGFAAVSAETLVVGATPEEPVTGRKADVIQAAWHAAEVVQRLVKVGNKNWQVTDAVSKIAAAFDCKPVEGALRAVVRSEDKFGAELVWGRNRYAVVPTGAERHRRQEAHHLEPCTFIDRTGMCFC